MIIISWLTKIGYIRVCSRWRLKIITFNWKKNVIFYLPAGTNPFINRQQQRALNHFVLGFRGRKKTAIISTKGARRKTQDASAWRHRYIDVNRYKTIDRRISRQVRPPLTSWTRNSIEGNVFRRSFFQIFEDLQRSLLCFCSKKIVRKWGW